MPRNGSGTYELPLPNVVDGTAIEASWANMTLADLATALTNSIAKDGETVWTGADDHNGNEIILDVDGDTSITADTDDRIDFKIGGFDVLSLTATSAAALEAYTDAASSVASHRLLSFSAISGSSAAYFFTAAPGIYNSHVVELRNLMVGTDALILLRFREAGQPVYDSGTNYDSAVTENGTISSATGLTHLRISTGNVGADTNEYGMCMSIIIDNMTIAGKWKVVRWTGTYINASGALVITQGCGQWKNTAAADRVLIQTDSNQVLTSDGKLEFYGVL